MSVNFLDIVQVYRQTQTINDRSEFLFLRKNMTQISCKNGGYNQMNYIRYTVGCAVSNRRIKFLFEIFLLKRK